MIRLLSAAALFELMYIKMLSRTYEVHVNILCQLIVYLLYAALILKKEIEQFSCYLINHTLLTNIHDIYI